MKYVLLVASLWMVDSFSVVMRHDVNFKHYEVNETPDYFIRMPHEGAGVLIHENWILSVAHTVFYDYSDKPIEIHGVNNKITDVIFHPGYKKSIPQAFFKGDASRLIDFLSNRDDIVLLKLEKPVAHVSPIERYRGESELNTKVTTFGEGAIGNGNTGEITETKSARKLHRYNNLINHVSERWLTYRFDKGSEALPLEGHTGSGDSGGPSISTNDGKDVLIGLTSWQTYEGDIENFVGGKYGMSTVLVRVSSYNDWIDDVIRRFKTKEQQ